jgi:hypothetical protein
MDRQLRRLHHTREHLAHVPPLVPGMTSLRPEEPGALPLVASLPEARERLLQLRPHVQPAILTGLRTPGSLAPDAPLDVNLLAREGYVRSRQAQRFAHAHADAREGPK